MTNRIGVRSRTRLAALKNRIRRLLKGEIKSRGLSRLNEITNPDKWDNPEWMKVHRALESYSVDKHCFNRSKEYAYRKGWE